MTNAALKRNTVYFAIPRVTVSAFLLGILTLQCFFLFTPAQAQVFQPEKFDKSILEDSLQDQEFLREEMLLEQEILREEMEQIRIEIQRIMKEITIAMKAEALKLKAELEGLQQETKVIQEELLGILEQSKQDFIAGKEEMQKELQKMRVEAKVLTKDIKQVLEDQKEVWKQETAALKDSLIEARQEMASAKVDSEEILQETQSAFSDIKDKNDFNLADIRAESNAALLDAGNAFKQSQQDSKEESLQLNAELKAGMNGARQDMQQGQREQRRDSGNANRDVLASLKVDKNSRIAELKKDANQKKLQRKRDSRSARKQVKKQKRTQSVEKRKGLITKSKAKAARKKAVKRIRPTRRDKKRSQGREDGGTKLFGEPGIRKIEKLPEQEEIVTEESAVVVASAPEGSVNSSEESPQEKLSRFSKNITDLKKRLKNSRGNPGALLAKLGDAYLEAQRYMDSKTDNEERQNLLKLSDQKGLLLGGYEQAAWAYKLALTFDRKNPATHLKIGKIYDEMEDGPNALMFTKLAHKIFKRGRNSSQIEETQTLIDTLTAKYEDKSGKKIVPKG
jgi:hypothetical protein